MVVTSLQKLDNDAIVNWNTKCFKTVEIFKRVKLQYVSMQE